MQFNLLDLWSEIKMDLMKIWERVRAHREQIKQIIDLSDLAREKLYVDPFDDLC